MAPSHLSLRTEMSTSLSSEGKPHLFRGDAKKAFGQEGGRGGPQITVTIAR